MCHFWVLIESDWNLKDIIEAGDTPIWMRINRIRLEFKATISNIESGMFRVLIESDWNLKRIRCLCNIVCSISINRIRLEFKEGSTGACLRRCTSINRIRLEFKGG